jgi:sulfur carrier protein ThiS
VLPACSVLVDGRVVAPDDAVANGTIIEVLPPFSGG